MRQSPPDPDVTAQAPQAYRDALAELVRVGITMVRMLETVAVAETAFAEAALQPLANDDTRPAPATLAEAIAADQAASAAAEARQTMLARAEAITAAFGRTSRSLRLTVLLAERIERGWARRPVADDRDAMARRQIARGVTEAIGTVADAGEAARLAEAASDRLERLETEEGIGDRPAEDIIRDICRGLGVDPVRMTAAPAVPGTSGAEMAPGFPQGRQGGTTPTPRRRPDG